MKISEDYERLMHYNALPERFRAGDFGLLEEESKTLREFVDSFYEAVHENGYVDLKDFTEFMDFLWVLSFADSPEVQLILTRAFMKSAEIRNALEKQQTGDNQSDNNLTCEEPE